LSILLGNGLGGFSPALTPLAVAVASSIRVAELNGDGKADLVFTDGNYASPVLIYLGNGDDTFSAVTPPVVNNVGNCPDVIVADFNGDGEPDLAVADDGPGGYTLGGVLILPGNGDGTFANDGKIGQFTKTSAVFAGDYNNDGLTDLNIPPNSIGPVTLAGWQEAVTVSDVAIRGSLGMHNILATYQGDALHDESSSAPIELQGLNRLRKNSNYASKKCQGTTSVVP